jgi:Tfp pilus assembly protein PilN
MVDLHKEIKLSDLFRRGSKEDGEPKAEKAPKEPKRPKKEKPPKERRRWGRDAGKAAAFAEQEAPPLLEIPLMRAFNLLPTEEARAAAQERRPLPYILVALTGVLVFAALAAFYLMAGADVSEKQAQVDDLRAELAVYAAQAEPQPSDDPAEALAAERLGRTNALSSALATRLAWDRVLRELALILPKDAAIDSIEATAPTAYNAPVAAADGSPAVHFTMVGGTDSQASVAELLARLSVIPEFENVALKLAARASEEGGGSARHPYVFTITATLRQGS